MDEEEEEEEQHSQFIEPDNPNVGLIGVLENKQDQINFLKQKLKSLERDNKRLDNPDQESDFEFDLAGIIKTLKK